MRGWEWSYVAAQLDQRSAVLASPGHDTRFAGFNTSGHVVALDGDGTMARWDPASGELLASNRFAGTPVALSPDGDFALYAAESPELRRTDSGTVVRAFGPYAGVDAEPYRFGVAQGGRFVAIGLSAGGVVVLDVETGERRAQLTAEAVGFHLDGSEIAFQTGRQLRFWDVTSDRETRQEFVRHRAASLSVVSPDGKWVAEAVDDNVRATEVGAGKMLWVRPGSLAIDGLAFDQGGSSLAVSVQDGPVQLVDLQRRLPDRTFRFQRGPSCPLGRYSWHGRWFVTATKGGREIHVWDTATKPRFVLGKGGPNTPAIAVAPRTGRIATSNRSLQVWEAVSASELGAQPAPGVVRALGYRSDGGSLLAVTADQVFEVDAESGQSQQKASLGASVDGVALALEHGLILTTRGREAEAFNASTLRSLGVFARAEWTSSAAVRPDGALIAIASGGVTPSIQLFDAVTLRSKGSLHAPATVRSIAWNPSGRVLAAGDRHGTHQCMGCWASFGGAALATARARRRSVVLGVPSGR